MFDPGDAEQNASRLLAQFNAADPEWEITSPAQLDANDSMWAKFLCIGNYALGFQCFTEGQRNDIAEERVLLHDLCDRLKTGKDPLPYQQKFLDAGKLLRLVHFL